LTDPARAAGKRIARSLRELATTVFGLGSAICASQGCESGGGGSSAGFRRDFDPGPVPAELHRGEIVFNTYCISCHGRFGIGEGLGPPLLDTLYLSPRLPDQAFHDAVEHGVRQKHWHFDAMPPVKRVAAADVDEIIRYVRWLQQRSRSGPG
jgi:mono/diheme cytochrome c family protein